MELGVNSAVLDYNEEACSIDTSEHYLLWALLGGCFSVLAMNVWSYFEIGNGYYMEKGSIKRDKISIKKLAIKGSESGKTKRKKSEL